MYETIFIDVMVNGVFHRQLQFQYCPIFKIDLNEVNDYVLEKCPSLKGKRYTIQFSEQGL